jgi:hypothetical protein
MRDLAIAWRAFGTIIIPLKENAMPNKSNKPLTNKEDIQKNPDKKIDQDFEGYPHGGAKENLIKPKTKEDKKTAAMDIKDGEKINYPPKETDEQDSDGSANAFDDK